MTALSRISRSASAGTGSRSSRKISPGGKPCIRGLRITVYEILEYLASGMTGEEILTDFPDLKQDDIRACLSYAADRERKFSSIPPR